MKTLTIQFLKALSSKGLLALLLLAGCTDSDPACLPYEGQILTGTPCAGDRVIMTVLNKNIRDIYSYDGAVIKAVSA